MIADIARIRILAVDDHLIIRSALGNEPEFHASLRPLGATQTITPRKFFFAKAAHACTSAASRKPEWKSLLKEHRALPLRGALRGERSSTPGNGVVVQSYWSCLPKDVNEPRCASRSRWFFSISGW